MADIAMIVGISDYNFQNQKGEFLSGRKFHCLVHSGNPRVQGYEVREVGASTQLMSTWVTADSLSPKVGDIAQIEYSRRGSLAGFRQVNESARALFDAVIIS